MIKPRSLIQPIVSLSGATSTRPADEISKAVSPAADSSMDNRKDAKTGAATSKAEERKSQRLETKTRERP